MIDSLKLFIATDRYIAPGQKTVFKSYYCPNFLI